jgi:hypothetical protein
MWRNLEQQVGVSAKEGEDKSAPLAAATDHVAGMIRRRPEPRSRRVFRSSYMS